MKKSRKINISSHKIVFSGLLFLFISSILFITTPAEAGTNLVINPSVETASTTKTGVPFAWYKGGYGTNTRTLTYPVLGFDQAKALKVDITSYTNGDAKWYSQHVPVTAGEKYAFSDYYMSTVPSTVTLEFKKTDGTYKYIDLSLNVPPAASWTQFSGTVTAPAGAISASIFHAIKSVGSLTTDNFSLSLIDTTAPTVSVTTPLNNATISGTTILNAQATDNSAVGSVQFFIDNSAFGVPIVNSPYSTTWDTTTVPNGTHSLFAVARDSSGNSATSSVVSVIVNNTPPPPPPATLTITTQVVNNDSGTKQISDFPLFLNGQPITSGVATTVPAGNFSVSETTDPNYTVSFSGNCDSSGNITLLSGDTKTCTITNDDKPVVPTVGTLSLSANVVSDNTGTKQLSDFSFTVDGVVVSLNTSLTFSPGVHVVAVSSFSGYTLSFSGNCNASGNVTVIAGNNVSCQMTLDDIPPPPPSTGTITVNISVINNNGGTKLASNFIPSVNGTSVTAGNVGTFIVGIYTVDGSNDVLYTKTIAGDCAANGAVTLASGDAKICTITYDDIFVPPPPPTTASFTVTTQVVNNDSGTKQISDFPLFLNGQPITSGVATTVPAGNFSVSETTDPNYTVSFSGNCDSSGNITLLSGDTKTCTITNDDKPVVPTKGKITVNIVVVNNSGGTKQVSDFPIVVSGQTVTSGTATTFSPGTYTVNETQDPTYTISLSGDCDSSGVITLAAGDNKVCTITNDDIPPPPPTTGTLTVNVVVYNDNVSTKQASDFPLYVDTQLVQLGTSVTLDPGVHFVTELSDPAYFHTYSGNCDASGNVTIVAGQNATCTIINDDVPNIIYNPSVEVASTTKVGLPFTWYKGGYGTNTRTLTYPVSGIDGAKAMKVDITSYTNGDAKWYSESAPVVSGTKYIFSDYYLSNVPSTVSLQFRKADGTYKYVDLSLNVPPATGWTQFTAPVTAPTDAVSVSVFHAIKSVGSLTTDNFSLKEFVPLLPTPHDPSNLVPNPTMEFVTPGKPNIPLNWHQDGYGTNDRTFTYPVTGYDSTPGAKVEIKNYTSGDAKWWYDDTPVTPGDEYRVTDYYQGSATSTVSIRFALSTGGYKYLDLENLVPSPTWKQFQEAFIVPANATSMTVFHVIKGVGTLTTDNYSMKKIPSGAFAQGMVSLNFDDGFESVYQNAIPILNTAGLKSSQWIITTYSYEQQDPYYMSPAQILEINGEGHEIGTHTYTHPHLTQLSDAQLQTEIPGAKATISAAGATPNNFFVYPYGDYNDRVMQVVKGSGFIGARSVRSGFNTRNSNKYALFDQHVENTTTVDQIKQWIDQAVANKYWLILEMHETVNNGGQYSNSPATLQAIVDYLVANHVPVVNMAEGMSLMN